MDYMEEVCFICNQEFTETSWQDRHESHEPNCGYHETGTCECDMPSHAKCCLDCNKKPDDLTSSGIA